MRTIHGTPVRLTEESAQSEITGTAVRPATCRARCVAAPFGGAINPWAPSSSTMRAASTASAPHCPIRPRTTTLTLGAAARFASSTASSTPRRKLAASASSGGKSNPMTTFVPWPPAQARHGQPQAAVSAPASTQGKMASPGRATAPLAGGFLDFRIQLNMTQWTRADQGRASAAEGNAR